MNVQKSELLSPSKNRRWPFGLFVTMTLLWNLLVFSSVQFVGFWVFQYLVPGLLLGEILGASVIVGLFGRSWLSGLFFGICLSCIGILSLFLGQELQMSLNLGSFISVFDSSGGISWLLYACFVPLGCLIISSPFYLARLIFGWQLSRDHVHRAQRESIQLADFFLIMTSLASIVWIARVPGLTLDNSGFLTIDKLIGGFCILCLYTLFVSVPATYGAFRSRTKRMGLVASFGLSMIAPIILSFSVELIAFATQSGTLGNNALNSLLLSASGGAILSIGLWSLRCSGYQLQYYARKPKVATAATTVQQEPESILPEQVEEDDDDVVRPRITSQPHFRWTMLFVSFAVFSSLAMAQWNSLRESQEISNEQLQERLEVSGGSIRTRDREVISLTLGKDYDASILSDIRIFGSIETLSFAHSDLPENLGEILERFPKLRELDLGYTNLDDASLERIRSSKAWSRLEHIGLAGTKISLQRTSGLKIGNSVLQSVDLSDLGISDDNILDVSILNRNDQWVWYSLRKLRLANNRLTDQGLAKVADALPTELLDLSGNLITGSFFRNYNRCVRLVLDNNPLSENDFGASVGQLNVQELVLRNTPLSDDFLAVLAKSNTITSIEFGDGNFTDEGLSKHFSPNLGAFRSLLLTGKQFSGECFKSWKPAIGVLSMKRSGLIDDNVAYLNGLPALSSLDLSETLLTDAGLAKLKLTSVNELNLTSTKVTAKGILNCEFLPDCQIIIGPDQFTRTEIDLLRLTRRIEFVKPVSDR